MYRLKPGLFHLTVRPRPGLEQPSGIKGRVTLKEKPISPYPRHWRFFLSLRCCLPVVPTSLLKRSPLCPSPPLQQQLPSSPAVLTEAPPAEDIPPLEPRKPADPKKPSLIPPPPITLSEEWLVVVKKGKRKLHLYRDCRLVKTFPIDLGENPKGPKLYQGDMRTPEGLYRVIEKKDRGQTKFYHGPAFGLSQ